MEGGGAVSGVSDMEGGAPPEASGAVHPSTPVAPDDTDMRAGAKRGAAEGS